MATGSNSTQKIDRRTAFSRLIVVIEVSDIECGILVMRCFGHVLVALRREPVNPVNGNRVLTHTLRKPTAIGSPERRRAIWSDHDTLIP